MSDRSSMLNITTRHQRTLKKESGNIRRRKKRSEDNWNSNKQKQVGLTSKKISEESGVANANRKKWIRILRRTAKDVKVTKLPLLTKHHIKQYILQISIWKLVSPKIILVINIELHEIDLMICLFHSGNRKLMQYWRAGVTF